MNRIHLDFGNYRLKWVGGAGWGEELHAIAPLNENEWRAITERGKIPRGYVKVNGMPYAIGDSARRHIIGERPRGSGRYVETYYGVGLAYLLSIAYPSGDKDIELIASFAPRDIAYTKDLKASAKRQWRVETANGIQVYNVRSVQTFDEPLAGFTNASFNDKGEERRDNPFATGSTLVIDVGGYTVDAVAVDGGDIDLSSLQSTVTGALNAQKSFESELRTNNRKVFQGIGDLDVKIVEMAMRTGEFMAGKVRIDCARESAESINRLTNQVTDVIKSMGGYIQYSRILLTGGGSMLIRDALFRALSNATFYLADDENRMMFANVRGLVKIGTLLDKDS